jgi:hypothetical protein
VGHETSIPLDTYESPAQACARSAQSDNLQGIDEATMQFIVKDPQCTVQTFLPGDRSIYQDADAKAMPCPSLSLGMGVAGIPTAPNLRIRSPIRCRVGLASLCSKGYDNAILRERKQSKSLYEELAMPDTIETRLARVERELAILRSKSTRDKSNWLSEISGSFKDDPHFDEIVRLGKEMRDAEQPENE